MKREGIIVVERNAENNKETKTRERERGDCGVFLREVVSNCGVFLMIFFQKIIMSFLVNFYVLLKKLIGMMMMIIYIECSISSFPP